MRKRYRVLIFAALVAALIVPVGYALSIESRPALTHARYTAVVPTAAATAVTPVMVVVPTAAATAVAAPAIIHRSRDTTATTMVSPVTDAAKLLLIGTVLFGLAAAVRKAL
jgi:hypothetical protein